MPNSHRPSRPAWTGQHYAFAFPAGARAIQGLAVIELQDQYIGQQSRAGDATVVFTIGKKVRLRQTRVVNQRVARRTSIRPREESNGSSWPTAEFRDGPLRWPTLVSLDADRILANAEAALADSAAQIAYDQVGLFQSLGRVAAR